MLLSVRARIACRQLDRYVHLGTIAELNKMLEQGETTSVALTTACLQRAEELKHLNAFITTTAEVALEQAAASDERRRRGCCRSAVDGIPMSVKDNLSTCGIRTTCASNCLRDYVPPYNATSVQRVLHAGAVLVGKTNLDEFAIGSGTTLSAFGPSYNPRSTAAMSGSCNSLPSERRTWHVAGGSSGGSAAAVAGGFSVFALGSDTGGSVRLPASWCGIVGLKPTYGRPSRFGLVPLASSMDTVGVVSSSVEDAAVVLDIISGHDPKDATSFPLPPLSSAESLRQSEKLLLEGLRVGIPKEYFVEELSSVYRSVWQGIADWFANQGAQVSLVSLPHTKLALGCYSVIASGEVASNLARYDGLRYGLRGDASSSTDSLFASARSRSFGRLVYHRILAGTYYLSQRVYKEQFAKAQQVRRLITEDFEKVFNRWSVSGDREDDGKVGVDVLLTPTTIGTAVTLAELTRGSLLNLYAHDVFLEPPNLAGLPSVSIPAGLDKGLPLGLQIIAPAWQELLLLRVAKTLEDRRPEWTIETMPQ